MIYSEQDLNELKELVEQRVSPKRFSHVLGVERCAARLASSLIPDSISEVRAAAILHDVSKQLPYAEQIDLLNEAGFELNDEDMLTEGVLHSFTAPIIIKRDFEKFSTDDILSATLKHTVGDEEMSIFDKIIFISDYAEDTRTYDSCIMVRDRLFEGFEVLPYSDKVKRLNEACLESIDGALEALKRLGSPINSRMYKTREMLLSQLIP